MIKVGLTGGYASGKTLVASELERFGCHVIYADRLGHAALEPGGAAYRPAIEVFGEQILNSDASIDRKKLASIVFGDPALLAKLEALVHPAVMQLEDDMLREFSAADPRGIGVVEAAILIEAGRAKAYDRIIVTSCEPETQISRGMKRDQVTRAEALSRVRKQMPVSEKVKVADYVINTDGEKAATLQQVAAVYADLKQLAES
jgi:dephospho-CoA kinase